MNLVLNISQVSGDFKGMFATRKRLLIEMKQPEVVLEGPDRIADIWVLRAEQ